MKDLSYNNVVVEEPATTETRTCICFGEILPIHKFKKYSGSINKRFHTCDNCRNKDTNKESNSELSKFTSRELIVELRKRGYTGELSFVAIKKVKI